jgi:hypothetical protein
MIALLFFLVALVFLMGLLLKIFSRWTTDEQLSADVKLVPADVVILCLSVNIATALRENSVLQLLPNPELRMGLVVALVISTAIVYCVLVALGRFLQSRNMEEPFCRSKEKDPRGIGGDRKRLIYAYVVGGVYFVTSFVLAVLEVKL